MFTSGEPPSTASRGFWPSWRWSGSPASRPRIPNLSDTAAPIHAQYICAVYMLGSDCQERRLASRDRGVRRYGLRLDVKRGFGGESSAKPQQRNGSPWWTLFELGWLDRRPM